MFMNFYFQSWDYVVLALTLILSTSIGVYYAIKGVRSTEDYHVANREMKVIPVAISLLVSFQSAVLILGFPAEMYLYGSQYWIYILSVISANLLSALLFAPLFHPLKLISSYEYLQMRFKSRFVRTIASLLGILSATWYSAIVLYGPAITLEVVTGFSKYYSIILIGVVGIVYTAIGGIKAVIWADAVQFILMVAGMIAVLVQACNHVGGLSKAWDVCETGGRINFFNFDFDPTVRMTFWGAVIGGTMKKIGFNLSQAAVQRISAMPTVSKARLMIILAMPGFILFGTLACLQGLVAYAYFDEMRCDPLKRNFISSSNQLMPFLVMTLFSKYPGLPGLFLSSIFSASLSTYSSNLNCISAQVWEDFLKDRWPDTKASIAALISKIIVAVFGAVTVGLSFLIIGLRGPLSQITTTILSSFGSTMTGFFLLGALFHVANQKGAIAGGLTGFTLVLWMSMGSSFSGVSYKSPTLPSPGIAGCPRNVTPFHNVTTANYSESFLSYRVNTGSSNLLQKADNRSHSALASFYSVSFMWFDAIGIATTIVVGLIVSYLSVKPDHSVESYLLIPVFRRLCPCFIDRRITKFHSCTKSVPMSGESLVGEGDENDGDITEQHLTYISVQNRS